MQICESDINSLKLNLKKIDMKNIIYFLALCITIVITSCSKEEKVFKEEKLISNETTNHFI